MGKPKKKTGLFYLVNAVLTAVLFTVLFVLISGKTLNAYYSGIITMVCINVILAVSLNLVTGILGQLVLGHAGFMLVGAYAAANFTKAVVNNGGMSLQAALPIAMLIGGVIAALFGIVIGIPALRLRGDYLAIITLGFGEIIRVMANAEFLKPITNGAMGLDGIKTFSTRKEPGTMFVFVFLTMALVIFISFTFGRSRHGRSVIAIREDEIAAESMGVNTTYYKLFAFVLAAFIAGVAGALYAHYIGVIDPSKFDFNRSVEILIMVVLGGMGSISGSVISATVLTILPEVLRDLPAIIVGWIHNLFALFGAGHLIPEGGGNFSDIRMLLYSIILVSVMLFRPSGLLGRYEISLPGLADKLLHRGKKTKTTGEV